MSIRVRRLRLVGVSQNYDVDFRLGDSSRNLAVIAGEISTGKTSVLEFVDFCLGASSHPKHQEVRRQVRSALLEVDLSGDVAVVERGLEDGPGIAFVHQCRIETIGDPHAKTLHPITPPSDPQSLSSLLLENCGLAGISLREAPSRSDSRTDPLSFRDVMWLCFLPNRRMDSGQLLHEANHMQNLKLRQVIDVVFGVHDDQLAQLAEAIGSATEKRRQLDAEIKALDRFLIEQEVPTTLELEATSDAVLSDLATVDTELAQLTASMQATTEFANQLRSSYNAAKQTVAQLSSRVRDRDTLVKRLAPLRGQYAEDEKKLVFYQEAKSLFDPLGVTVCPSCLQPLEEPAKIQNGDCSLCGRVVPSGENSIDVAAELNSTRLRRREIDKYIDEVEAGLAEARLAQSHAMAAEADIQKRLDATVAQSLAPFVAQRDDANRRREQAVSRQNDIARQLRLHAGLLSRRDALTKLDENLDALRERSRQLQEHRPSKEAVVGDLSQRFAAILADFTFPKLDDPVPPYIDQNYVPHVRGNSYRDIGSTGGMTLISLAWFLAIFGRVVDTAASHPGFLMIDSPQKNLTPRSGTSGDDFTDPAIVSRVWAHLASMTRSAAFGSMQLIVVDNAPPEVAHQDVVVRYGGPLGPPPYGLIENETG